MSKDIKDIKMRNDNKVRAKADLITKRIKLWGIVQGVGFRPFVAKQAAALDMRGTVKNTGGLVEIVLTDTPERIGDFIEKLQDNKPKPAEIVHIKIDDAPYEAYERFGILGSDEGDDEIAMIPADIAICPDCLREMRDPGDRRYRHPFISCMVCGPRYTIIDRIPYDRDNTAMIDWPMCSYCQGQYDNIADRRHHAQTVSCHDCGPYLIFRERTCEKGLDASAAAKESGDRTIDSCALDAGKNNISGSDSGTAVGKIAAEGSVAVKPLTRENALKRAAELLKEGGVIAFKSPGGYNLMADPFNAAAVRKLRRIKNREQKPFAVMFRSCDEASAYANIDKTEKRLLESSARPIVLLERKPIDEMPGGSIACRNDAARQIAAAAITIDAAAKAAMEAVSAERAAMEAASAAKATSEEASAAKVASEIVSAAKGASEKASAAKAGQESDEKRDAAASEDAKASINTTETIVAEHRSSAKTALPFVPSFREFEKSRFIGTFLPSLGAQYLLLDEFGGPLISTSANLTDMPMIIEDEEMMALMDKEPLIDGMLYNERDIRVRVDDSVVRVIDDQPQMIRRSKGYAPVPLYTETSCTKDDMIFAVGGQLKNSFALTKGGFTYMSQFFGDMDSLENQEIYAASVSRMEELFRIRPTIAVCDMHPLYATTAFAEKYAREHGIELIKVQHHHAHVASVMAEHDLKGDVIGVSMDGTGYGTDGNVWGSEFLLCNGSHMQRLDHLVYTEMIGGDGSMKEGWKSALCFRHGTGEGKRPPWGRIKNQSAVEAVKTAKEADAVRTAETKGIAKTAEHAKTAETAKAAGAAKAAETAKTAGAVKAAETANGFSDGFTMNLKPYIDHYRNVVSADFIDKAQPLIYGALDNHINTIKSSSMGRLFDAISSLLGICHVNSYEGQCAMLLEDAAQRGRTFQGASRKDELAWIFHEQLAELIMNKCIKIREKTGASQVALTGGVFQNRILMEETLRLLRSHDFDVYYNISVSPNDGGIALGQAYIAMKTLEERRQG